MWLCMEWQCGLPFPLHIVHIVYFGFLVILVDECKMIWECNCLKD